MIQKSGDFTLELEYYRYLIFVILWNLTASYGFMAKRGG